MTHAPAVRDDDAGDAGPDLPDGEAEDVGGRRSPLRRCIATGRVGDRSGMVRFVLGPDGIVPDLDGRLPGRGHWVSADRAVLESAVKRRQFARAARKPVEVPADLVDRVEAGLRKRCLSVLGLARRAGQIVAGFEQVRDALSAGKVALRVEAGDGSPDGRDKLTAVRRDVPTVVVFSAAELAEALGRAHVVHVAILGTGFATRFRQDLDRWSGIAAGAVPDVRTGTGTGSDG